LSSPVTKKEGREKSATYLLSNLRFLSLVQEILVLSIHLPARHRFANRSYQRAYTAASDVELLQWSARGDREAFDLIVLRHGASALRVAARVVSNSSIAEELAQEALVRAWKQAGYFDPKRARFSTWLHRIVVNLCIDHGRRIRPGPIPEDFDLADPGSNADEQIEADERRVAIAQAVAALPVNQRAALKLVYDEGMSGAEAARALGSSAKAVERLLSRARDNLRKRLSLEP
jgi:RNA polymerase sigma-70 factor (ECF subfamily)